MEWTVNGFRDHDGKGMPVDGDTMVFVRFRDNPDSVFERRSHPASEFLESPEKGEGEEANWWKNNYAWFDIVAYKVDEK